MARFSALSTAPRAKTLVHPAIERSGSFFDTRDFQAFAAQWLAYALPYRRFGRLNFPLRIALLRDARARSGKLSIWITRLTWVTAGYGWFTNVAPFIVAAPGYFAGDMSLGGLMMAVGAFNQVQQALRWFRRQF
jgi:hypothetical protein